MLYICRGLPGSGKSTFAKSLNCHMVESDHYFIVNGEYIFDTRRLQAAHIWCFEQVEKALKTNMDVVVSNTFTQYWELKPYIKLAKKFKIPYRIYELHTQYGNIHNLPEEKMECMKNRWEDISDLELVELITTLPVPPSRREE